MTINQALPIVSLSKVPKDPRAFGVISLTQDHPAGPSAAISAAELLKLAEQGDVRVQINSLGEGCIWVCDDTGSNIHAGGIIQFGEGGSSTISFSNAPDTGLFNPVAGTLGVVAGGTEMVRVSDTTVSLLGDLVVSSNIVPMTNATQYLGTSTMHFKEAWIDELHISSNTLYIGDTPVLCADNDAVSIRADPGQGITLTTTGDGETSLVSAKGVNVVSEGGVTMRVSGPLGRVNIQSSGAGGTVNLGAEKEIVMTAPLTTISSNMIVKGDLTVEGTQLTLNTQTVTVEDNIIVLNSGNIHNGEQNMRCFVDTAGNCIVKCFSATCDNHAPACIGRLVEPAGDSWDAGAALDAGALNERAWGRYVNTIDSSVLMLNNFTNYVKSHACMDDRVRVYAADVHQRNQGGRTRANQRQVHKAALDTFDDPKDAARLCLLHTSKTADAVKAMLIDVDALWSSKRIVVYTPTISAGVDFSTEHFDRMYLYLCPGSAAPMGALQMTGRVRHLVDTDVRTLVAKNMRVAREATRQHLTHVDLYQWLRWMEGFSTCLDVKHIPAIDGGDDHTLQELSDGVLAPLFATVAPPTLKMTVESYFLAEIYNASFDYVSCFADLLEHAGHRMDLGTSYAAVSAARVHAPPEGDMEATSEFLMRVLKAQEQLDALTGVVHAPVLALAPDAVPVPAPAPDTVSGTDIPTAMRRKDLMDAIEQRVMANDASEDDKFIMYLSRYCSAWGIDRVDEAFLLENKPGAVGSPKARLLSRLLCPILRPVRGADVHTTEHSGQASCGVRDGWDLSKVSKAVKMILNAVGLDITSQTKRVQIKGKRTQEARNYRLCPDSVSRMLELVKLRLLRTELTPFNVHAAAALSGHELSVYSHLVDFASPVAYVFEPDDDEPSSV
eukprot:gene27840-biopygen5243